MTQATRRETGVNLPCLRTLYEEAIHGRGWRRRGVRGWRFFREIRSLTDEYMIDALPPLAHKGLAERIDVRYPGRQKPEWIYRITPAGVAALAHLLPGPPAPLPEPEERDADAGCLYLPAHIWSVAEDLRERARLDVGLKRFGASGWMRISELNRLGRARISNELEILAELGLAQRRETDVIHGHRRVPVWRITARGAALGVVDAARVGADPPLYIQLRQERPSGPTAREVDRAWAQLTEPGPLDPPASMGTAGPAVAKVARMDTGPRPRGERA